MGRHTYPIPPVKKKCECGGLLNKEQFMQEYILRRAIAIKKSMDGYESAKDAERAFDYIIEKCK